MPGYGIAGPQEGRGLLPWAWAEQRLEAAERYWLATVSPDGAPHVMPLWAVWLDGQLWFSTGGRSRKARNLRADPRCAIHLEGDEPLIVNGLAAFVTDAAAIERMVAAYGDKYPETPPDPAENPIVRVRPQQAFGMIEAEFAGSPTRWSF